MPIEPPSMAKIAPKTCRTYEQFTNRSLVLAKSSLIHPRWRSRRRIGLTRAVQGSASYTTAGGVVSVLVRMMSLLTATMSKGYHITVTRWQAQNVSLSI